MFKKKLQSYFKYFIQRIFILIYGKVTTLKINDINDEEFVKINGIQSDTYYEKEYFVYKIKNGRIYTDTNQKETSWTVNNVYLGDGTGGVYLSAGF